MEHPKSADRKIGRSFAGVPRGTLFFFCFRGAASMLGQVPCPHEGCWFIGRVGKNKKAKLIECKRFYSRQGVYDHRKLSHHCPPGCATCQRFPPDQELLALCPVSTTTNNEESTNHEGFDRSDEEGGCDGSEWEVGNDEVNESDEGSDEGSDEESERE